MPPSRTIAKARAKGKKSANDVYSLGVTRSSPDGPRAALEATWTPAQITRIDRALDDAVKCDALVAFDWDNTVMRGDIGDLVMLEVLAEHEIQKPAQWSEWGPLTEAAVDALNTAFGTSSTLALEADTARALLAEIAWSDTAHGAPAFDPRTNEVFRAPYWMMACLLEALPEETRIALSQKAFGKAQQAPLEHRARNVEAFARPRPAMLALARWAESRGVATWVVSASEETIVRAIATSLGFDGARVIGASPAASLQTFGERVMTFDEGKRMHLAHRACGQSAEAARGHRPRIAIACGDSDTDFGMLACAELIVLFDRGQPRVTKLAEARDAIRLTP